MDKNNNEEISIKGHHISNDDLIFLVKKIKPIVVEINRLDEQSLKINKSNVKYICYD